MPIAQIYPVLAFKPKNIWWLTAGVTAANVLVAYQAKGAASLAASYVNLNSPGTNDANPVVAPTWDATNGWIFNGSTQYLDSGVLPTATTSALIQFTNGFLNTSLALFGSYSGNNTTRFTIWGDIGGGNSEYEHADALAVAGTKASGNMGIAAQQGYYNGVANGGTIPGTWSGTATITVQIGRVNSGPYYGQFNCTAFVLYSITLSAGQMLAIANAMAAL